MCDCYICGEEFEWHPHENLLQIGEEEDYAVQLCSNCQTDIKNYIEYLKSQGGKCHATVHPPKERP